MDEQDLIERLKKGQPWAFNTLVKTYQDRLLKIAYGITLDHEDSLEIVQDVFTSVFKHIQNFRQDASLATWLRKITINQCLNWKRKWKRRLRWHHDPMEVEDNKELLTENKKKQDPEMQVSAKEFEGNLLKAIQKLPEKIRIVLVLNAFEGLSYEEIAQTMNIKKGTVSSRLHFARKKLINSLDINSLELN